MGGQPIIGVSMLRAIFELLNDRAARCSEEGSTMRTVYGIVLKY